MGGRRSPDANLSSAQITDPFPGNEKRKGWVLGLGGVEEERDRNKIQ